MKFTNGYWMLRDGVDALYAREAYELNINEDNESLNVLAPTSVVRGRYDTLNLPTFNIDITTPAEGVIRVTAGHWQGATEYPGFPGSTRTNRAVVNTCTPWRKAMATAKWAKTALAFR